MFTDIAYAMGQTGQSGTQQSSPYSFIIMMAVIFGIFYFLMIRPQQKRQKAHKEMLGRIAKGDRVITSGGLYGTVTGVTDTTLTLEIAPKIRVKVARSYVSNLAGQGTAPPPEESN
ncbi:MAG: preprotein translocase subunit YajC [Thermodesulfobacteriota bacterium]